MNESQSMDYVKALFYVFGREDSANGRGVDADTFAHAWVAYVTANDSRVSLKSAFEQFASHNRIVGFAGYALGA